MSVPGAELQKANWRAAAMGVAVLCSVLGTALLGGDAGPVRLLIGAGTGAVTGWLASWWMLRRVPGAARVDGTAAGAEPVADEVRRLRDQITWHEAVLDAIPFPLSITDVAMNWTFTNKAVQTALGVRRADAVGLPCEQLEAPICRTEDCGVMALRAGRPRTTFSAGDTHFQVDTTAVIIDGKPVGHVETIQDVSSLAAVVAEVSAVLGRVADGDLTSRITGAYQDRQAIVKMAVNQSLDNLSDLVRGIAGMTDQLAGTTDQLLSSTGQLASSATETVASAEVAEQAVRRLGEAGQEINRIVELITVIAKQTNLLALNATIEAARAGHAGRGFSVVAEEVKGLARETEKSTTEISGRVTGIQNGTEETVSAIGAIVSAVNGEATSIADGQDAASALRTVVGDLRGLIDRFQV